MRARPSAVRLLGLSAVLALAGGTAGCGDALPTPPRVVQLDAVTFRAGLDVRESFPVQLGFRLEARNRASSDVHLITDGCGLGARAYLDSDRRDPPTWNGRPTGPCTPAPVSVLVPAGETRSWRRTYSAADVLGDSLPDGRYYFTASLGTVSLQGSENVERVEVAAGDAYLDVSP